MQNRNRDNNHKTYTNMAKMMSKEMVKYIKGYFKTEDYRIRTYKTDPRMAIVEFGLYESDRNKEDSKFDLYFFVREDENGNNALALTQISMSYSSYDFPLGELGGYYNERQLKSIAKALPKRIHDQMTEQFKKMHPDAIS